MAILSTILNVILKLLGLGEKAADAAERKEHRDLGRVLQTADDLKAQNDALQRMRQAATDAPATQKELDDALDRGEV